MATYPEFKSPLTQVWQYLGRNLPYFKKVLGIVSTPVETTGFDPDCSSSCNLINNYTLTIAGVQYDVYRLQGTAIMEDPKQKNDILKLATEELSLAVQARLGNEPKSL